MRPNFKITSSIKKHKFFILDEGSGVENKEIIISKKNENNYIRGDGNMIRVKSVSIIHNNEISHTHSTINTDNNDANLNSNNNDNYNNDKNTNNYDKTGIDTPSKNRSRSGSPKLSKPLTSYNTNTTSSTSTGTTSCTFPPYSSSDWPSSHTQSVMACFSHASSLDAFIISAVIPVWNHALVSTKHKPPYI